MMAAFAVLGLMPDPGMIGGVTRGDLIAHLVGWIVGAVSGRIAFPRVPSLILGLILLSYSVLIEIGQIFVPSRSFDPLDILANGAGVVGGLVLMSVLIRRQ